MKNSVIYLDKVDSNDILQLFSMEDVPNGYRKQVILFMYENENGQDVVETEYYRGEDGVLGYNGKEYTHQEFNNLVETFIKKEE